MNAIRRALTTLARLFHPRPPRAAAGTPRVRHHDGPGGAFGRPLHRFASPLPTGARSHFTMAGGGPSPVESTKLVQTSRMDGDTLYLCAPLRMYLRPATKDQIFAPARVEHDPREGQFKSDEGRAVD